MFFVLGLASCGLKLGEKNPEPVAAQVKSAQCLNQAISDLKVFFSAEASDEQVASSLICIQNVFVAFKENIRGENKNLYTAREIATFVQINFLNESDTQFTDDFLNQIMKFKMALFGGDDQIILKSEINVIVDFIARINPEIVRLNPYMKILTSKWNGKLNDLDDSAKEKQFLAAKNQFKIFLKKICLEFSNGNRAYKIDDLFDFIIETLKYTKAKTDTIDTVTKAKPFFKNFKFYLIGGNEALQGDDWGKLGLTIHEAYFQSLRFEYFIKILDPHQVEAKWSVYEKIATDLTSLIENLLKTKETQSLTNKEIFELLDSLSQIVPEVGLTEDLLNELGDVKVMLLGDSSIGRRGWSLNDFGMLRLKLPTLFKNLSVLVETFDILLKSKISYPDFLAAEVKILSAINNLSLIVEKSYNLDSLKHLVINLSEGPFKNTLKLPDHFEALYAALVSGKYLLTGEPGTTLSQTQIQNLMNVGIRAYLNYSEYDIFASPYKFESIEFISALEKIWPKVKTTIYIELNFKPEHFISTAEFTQFVGVLQDQKLLKTKIKSQSLDSLFNALWTHLLNKPTDRLNSIFRKGFDAVGFLELSNELDIWLSLQKNITEIFIKSNKWGKNEILSELDLRIKNEKNDFAKTGLIEQRNFLNQSIAMTFNESGFLRILAVPAGLYHQADLTKSNIARILSRIIIRSYANESERIQLLKGVLKDEIQVAYNQLKPLAVDLDIIDASNTTFINSRFLEANLFLSVADGDLLASQIELHHLILHIFSGVARADDIKLDILKNCLPPQISEVTGQTAVWEECVLDQYLTNERSFKDLPEFLNMRTQFKTQELRDYYFNLLKAAGHVPNIKMTVLLSDAALFPHVVQYVEMVYARHDLNHDNFLQKDEALLAFPLFKSLLKDLVKSYKQIKEGDLPGVFVYILKYGRPPRKESISELLKFVAFIKDKDQKDWTINSSRLDLGKIFNYIADSTKPSSTEVVGP